MRNNPERMRYQKNAVSFYLCLLAVAADVLYFIFLYTWKNVRPDIHIGADILINIFFMLFAFLASEKTKTYVKNWSYALFAVAAVQLLRVFYCPLKLFDILGAAGFCVTAGMLAAGAAALAAAGLINLIKSKILIGYLAGIE
ncbi:MAG: hypothetical protein LBL66_11325 [Clostridiales bacterium]|nr:hypothetical protein [Clostridiales bacterium]